MGVETFLAYVESTFGSTSKSVDLLDLANKHKLSVVAPGINLRPEALAPLSFLVDGECCLDRFYGGYYSDWVSGGQWNRMITFVSNLSKACKFFGLQLTVCLRGGLEKDHEKEFDAITEDYRTKLGLVLKHLQTKGTPPPKVWWIPPTGLRECLAAALHACGMSVLYTGADYYKEVATYCLTNNLHGVITDNAIFALLRVPRLFAARQLKLTYKGTLESKEYFWDKVLKAAGLTEDRLPLCATLLGNHLIGANDLHEFHRELLQDSGIDSNARNKEHEACIVGKVIQFVRELVDPADMAFIAARIFRCTKENAPEKVALLQTSVDYYRSLAHHTVSSSSSSGGSPVGANERPASAVLVAPCPVPSLSSEDSPEGNCSSVVAGIKLPSQTISNGPAGSGNGQPAGDALLEGCSALSSGLSELRLDTSSPTPSCVSDAAATPNHLQAVNSSIMLIARDRHRKGLMCPWIYQALTERAVRLPVCIEDEGSAELPRYVDLYRPLRQGAYALLFNLNKIQFELKRKADEEGRPAPQGQVKAEVKELFHHAGVPQELTVTAVPLQWSAPSVESLWLGVKPENKGRRLKAFFTLMRSDVPLLQSSACVPDHFVFPCCILRYMLLAQQSGSVLRKHELEAFLAMCTSRVLYDVQTMQDMQIPFITTRGVQLATLFMAGVQHATLVNDACGAPVMREVAQPWLYFDGKLFQYKLLKALNGALSLDLCDGQVDQLALMERLRQAVLEGVPESVFARTSAPGQAATTAAATATTSVGSLLANGLVRFSANGSAAVAGRPDGGRGSGGTASMQLPLPRQPQPVLRQPAQPSGSPLARNGGGLLGEYRLHGFGASTAAGGAGAKLLTNLSGGQLQIAGQVVASWGPNVAVATARAATSGTTRSSSSGAGQHGTASGSLHHGQHRHHHLPPNMSSATTAAAAAIVAAASACLSPAQRSFQSAAMLANYHYNMALYQGAPAILSSSRAAPEQQLQPPRDVGLQLSKNKNRAKRVPQKVLLQSQRASSPKTLQILNGNTWQQRESENQLANCAGRPAGDGAMHATTAAVPQPKSDCAAACVASSGPSDQPSESSSRSASDGCCSANDSGIQGDVTPPAAADSAGGGASQAPCVA